MRINYKKTPTVCNIEKYLFDRTKAELARFCGVTAQAVNWWSNGQSVPNSPMRSIIVDYLAEAVEGGLSEADIWPMLKQ